MKNVYKTSNDRMSSVIPFKRKWVVIVLAEKIVLKLLEQFLKNNLKRFSTTKTISRTSRGLGRSL